MSHSAHPGATPLPPLLTSPLAQGSKDLAIPSSVVSSLPSAQDLGFLVSASQQGGTMEEDADAIAQAMGFSSFGAQNPNKRRKFNPRIEEAVVASTPGLPLHQNKGSGSNATPLGERNIGNKDEISLEDEDEQERSAGAGQDQARVGVTEEDADPEPQYIDTSHPPSLLLPNTSSISNDPVQTKIDAIVGGGSGQPPSVLSSGGHQGFPRSRGRGGGSYQSDRGYGRQDGKPWWDDYYDPACNMNPWEKLEKERDMPPRGTWLTWEESKARWEEVKPSTGVGVSST